MSKDNKLKVGEQKICLLPALLPIEHDKVLARLLNQIPKINFHSSGGIKPQDKITPSQYRIIIVEYLLKKARDNNWGLCLKDDHIYVYNGAYWKKMDKASMISFLGKVAKKTGLVWSMHMDYQFKDQLYKQFVSSGHLQVPSSSREMETLINLKNGTYHVSSTVNRLMSFESSDFITHQLQFCHDGNAKCSKFEQFLNQVLPDLSSQLVLAEFIASTFISQKFLKLEKALILYGAGANGKSVIFDIIVALLGRENVSSYSLGSLTNESGYHRAEIANKLLNYASEIHGKMQSDIFKQLVSGEPIEARSPYGRPHIIEDYAKFMFNGNELPAEVEQTHAFFRRFIILPFNVSVPEADQDKELSKNIIKEELPGIFNWVLKGLDRLIANKNYTQCEASITTVNEYKKQSNTVLLFIDEEEYAPSLTNTLTLKQLYSEYSTFCRELGYRAVPNNIFSERLKKAGFETNRSSSGVFVYIVKKGSKLLALMS